MHRSGGEARLTPEEIRILLAACRGEKVGAAGPLPPELWELAEAHHAGLLLAAAVPDGRERTLRGVARNMAQGHRLRQLLTAFQKAGIPVVPFKGPILDAILWGPRLLRDYCDLDILVRRDAVADGWSVLEACGFRAEAPGMRPDRNWITRQNGQLLFTDRKDCAVELHWQLHREPTPCPLDTESLWARLQTMEWEGIETSVFDRDDLALYLCFHGCKEYWQQLSHVCDLARYMVVRPDIDWGRVTRQAEERRCLRMVLLGLNLAAELLAAPVPPGLLERSRCDPHVIALSRSIQDRMFRLKAPRQGPLDGIRYYSRLSGGMSPALRHALYGIFHPTIADWRAWPLPVRLQWFYWLARPVRLAGKYLGVWPERPRGPERSSATAGSELNSRE